jgi:N-acetylmuramoyl-L-alanine amidase
LKKLLLVLSLLLTVSSVQADEMDCLVEALYHEARSEEIVPMIAVGNVIMERVRSERFPNTVCEVVHQGKYWKYAPILNQCQFSYWCDGKPEKFNDMEALYKSMEVASMVFQGIVLKQTMGATHYHASYVRPFWSLSSRFKLLEQVGTHLFYIDIKK